MLAIAWEYLTGRSVATHPANRQEPEWPPHPDRVFQALVAAWGESGQDAQQRAALEWLEAQDAPQVAVPSPGAVLPGATPKVFVPVNDTPDRRKLKDRTFPSVLVGHAVCALIWPNAKPAPEHLQALGELCRAVTRIGHSRSLVRMWLTDVPPAATWEPVNGPLRSFFLRVPTPGRMLALERSFRAGERPTTAPWKPYGPVRHGAASVVSGAFDDRLVVLRRCGGDSIGVLQTLAWTEALRGALLAAAPEADPALVALISGHEPDGSPLQRPHLAFLPLPDVGHHHADGHLLGFALAMPKGLPADIENGLYRVIACAIDAETDAMRLTAGQLGYGEFTLEQRPVPPLALRPETWTHAALDWATVTPIVLDRFPPRRHADCDAWAAEQITCACRHQGLPDPVSIAIQGVSRFVGAPPSRAFPPWLRRPDRARRWHVHAWLRFPIPIRGPLLLGAGRYRGYGLCRPLPQDLNA